MAKITKEELQQPLFDTWRKSLDDTGKSIDSTNSKMDQLAKTYKELINLNEKGQKSIDAMMKSRKGLEEVTRKTTETDKASIQLKKEQDRVQTKLQQTISGERDTIITMQAALAKETGERRKNAKESLNQLNAYQKLQKETKEAREETRKLAAQFGVNDKRTIAARKAYEKLDTRLQHVNKTTANGRVQFSQLAKTMSKAQSSAARLAGIFGAGLGASFIARDSLNVIVDYEQAQANLASVLGVTIDKTEKLSKQQQELGSTTTFTAAQVAELQTELAKLGFTESQIIDMTESTLALAEATGTDLAEAATVAGSTLRGFGLEASDTDKLVDVMAKAFSSSSLDMEKFKTAMAAVAPAAKTAGFTLEKTTALLGTLTDNGIDASTAGTGLRNIFLELTKNGLSFEEAMEKIATSSDKNATALELFGKRGATLGVVLSGATSNSEELSNEINNIDPKILTDALKDISDEAKELGISTDQVTAFLGNFSLKGKDVGESSKLLEKSFQKLSNDGVELQDALDQINNSQDKAATSSKLLGKESAELGVIMAESQDSVTKLTGKLNNADGAAKKMADTQRNTLGGSLKLLRSAWEGFILELNEGSGAGEKLRWVIQKIAENLPEIISGALRLIRIYAIWRVTTSKLGKSTIELSKALVKSNGNIVKMIRSLKDGKKGFEGAGKSAKAMGSALKSIGFAIAIDMALEFAIALWDIVTASEAVRVAEEGRARSAEIEAEARSEGVAKAEQKIGDIREQIEKEIGQLQKDFDAGRIKSQEEYNAKVEEATDLAREGIKQFVQNSIDEEARFNSVAGVKIKSVEDFNKAIKLQEFFVKLAQDRVEKLAKSSDDFFGSQIKSAEFNLKVQQQTLSEAIARKTFIDELINQGGEYRKELLDQGLIINHQAKIEKKNNSQRKEAHLTEIDLLKEINDLHAKRLELEQEESREVLAQRIANIDRLIEKETELQMMRSAEEGGFDFTEIQRLSNERLRLRIEAIDSEAEHEINKLKDTLETSQKERREAIQKDFEDKIAAADNDAQLAEELKQELKKIDAIELAEQEVLQNEISNINNEAARSRVDLEQETKDEIIEINEELNDSLKRLTLDEIFEREANLKRLELLQDFTKDREEIEEEYTDFLIDQLERRIAAEKAAGEDTIDLELQLAELRRKGREDNTNETKEALEELLDLVKQYADLTFEEASKLSKEQQDLLEDEISAQEAVIESKKQSADQGNATAEESLKVEEEILEQKKEALKEEKKREEAIRQLEAFYTLVTQFLEQGDNAGVAAGKAAAGTLGIKAAGEALFNSLGGFYEGTDWKLGQEHTPFKSGKDGHVVRVDSEEGIANPSLMNMAEGAGLSSMDEVFNKAVMFQQLSGSSHELPSVNYYERNDSALLYALEQNNKLQKQIKQSIENNPSIIFKTEESKSGLVNAMAMGVKKGNITEWYRNKSRS